MATTLSLPGDDGAEECGDPLGDSLGVAPGVVGIQIEDPAC